MCRRRYCGKDSADRGDIRGGHKTPESKNTRSSPSDRVSEPFPKQIQGSWIQTNPDVRRGCSPKKCSLNPTDRSIRRGQPIELRLKKCHRRCCGTERYVPSR